jgi:hypothetical protein
MYFKNLHSCKNVCVGAGETLFLLKNEKTELLFSKNANSSGLTSKSPILASLSLKGRRKLI